MFGTPSLGVPIVPTSGMPAGGVHVWYSGSVGSGPGLASGSSRSIVPAVEMPSSAPSVGSSPYDALMPRSAVREKRGIASTAMSLRHQREYQRFQIARAQPANAAGTHHHAASSTGPPNESSTLTAVQSTPAPTSAPTMSTTIAVRIHPHHGPRPRR